MFGHFSFWDIFACLQMAIWPNWPKYFRSCQKTWVCDRKIPKKGWNTVKGNLFDLLDKSIRARP